MTSQIEIRSLIQTFQDGYTRRDVTQVDSFMQLFTSDAEVIGTNGVKPGVDEWYTDRASARELVEGDWVAASATVTKIIGSESYASYLEFIKTFIDTPKLSAEQKLLHILRGGTNTVYEMRRGETFVWALRFTAVVLRDADGWKFAQMNFSFPTVYYPDVRLMGSTSG